MASEDKKAAPKKPNSGRVFDVSRPGKSPASPTSKPVIVGHKPEAQQAQTAVSGIGEARPLLNKRKIEIVPSVDSQQADAAPAPAVSPDDVPAGSPPSDKEQEALAAAAIDAVAGPPPVPEAKTEEPTEASALLDKPKVIEPPKDAAPEPEKPAEPEPEPEPEPAEPAASAPETVEVEKSVTDQPLTNTSSVPETETQVDPNAAPEQEAPPQPKIEPLFDDAGHIVVSHHDQHGNHGVKVALLLLLILLLAVVGFNLALDLEVLKLEGVPRTDFF